MKKVTAVVGLLVIGSVAVGCASPEPEPEATQAAPEPVETTAEEVVVGTREAPIAFGESVTITALGEAGGDAWNVTINEPTDITQTVLDEAIALYGDDDESYLAPYRPDEGNIFLGVNGTVERLLDHPEDPFVAITLQFVTDDGRTVETTAQSSDDRPALMDLGDMYAPASATFMEVFEVPAGTTGQVLLTARDTGEQYYFG